MSPIDPRTITQIGRYRVRRFIAEGGMAWVFEVIDPLFEGHEVVRALKLLKPAAAEGVELERFRLEAAKQAELDHPNLVTVFEFGQDEATGCFYYTMVYVDGGTLAQLLERDGPLSVDRTVEVFSDILSGLAVLHRVKIVHRDIKPHNIFLHTDGRVRLGDLGIARVQDTAHQTRTGFGIGTVLYMSPEQARGDEQGPQSDVFSVGLTLYECLAAQNVYKGVEGVDSTNDFEVIGYLASRGRAGETLEIDFASAAIPEPIAEVIRKSLNYLPPDRYQDASEMREMLRQAAASLTADPHPVREEDGGGWIKWAAAAGIAALLAAGFFGWKLWGDVQNERAALGVIEKAEARRSLLPELRARALELAVTLPGDLNDEIDRAVLRADEDLGDARQYAEIEQWEATRRIALRARVEVEEACDIVTAPVLAFGAEAKNQVDRGVRALRNTGVDRHLPKEWAALSAEVDAIQATPQGEGCATTQAGLDHVAALQAASASVDSVAGALVRYLPNAVQEASGELASARDLAKAESPDVAEYRDRIARADSAAKRGDASRVSADLSSALEAYNLAIREYRDAEQVVSAAKAQTEARELLQQLGDATPGTALLVVSSADQRYTNGEWQEAAADYRVATVHLREGIRQAELAQVAQAKLSTAKAARSSAVSGDAGETEEFRSAEEHYTRGTSALESKQFEKAAESFDLAASGFEAALQVALALQVATQRNTNEELARVSGDRESLDAELSRFCKDADAPPAVAACEQAVGTLEVAGGHLTAKSPGEATRALDSARGALERARKEQAGWQWDPVINERTPSDTSLSARRGHDIELAIAAEDRNHDFLRYAWEFEGSRLPETGPKITHRPASTGRMTVTVDDGTGRTASVSWQIDVLANTAPRLALEPSAARIELETGQRRDFSSSARDEDGDEVTIAYELDGVVVAKGAKYRFRATEIGEWKLKVVATDSQGAAASATKTIVVRAAPPPPKPATTTTAKKTRKPPTTIATKKPAATADKSKKASSARIDASAVAQQVLRDYEAAYEARDVDALARIWEMSKQQREGTATFFSDMDQISMSIQMHGAKAPEPDRILVDFDQTVEAPGVPSARVTYTATLVRKDQSWAISKLAVK